MPTASIVWFRNDLRLHDNPALGAAAKIGGSVAPVFIWAPEEEKDWPPGAASRWWLHHSLKSLAASLKKLRLELVIRRGASLDTLRALINETKATHLFWNQRYEPALRRRDEEIQKALQDDDVAVETFNGSLLFEPDRISTREGRPFQVFSAYWRACQNEVVEKPIAAPERSLVKVKRPLNSLALEELGLLPSHAWTEGLAHAWQPGEQQALSVWKMFRACLLGVYEVERDYPSQIGTSRLSPHLHFGEIGPRRLWWDVIATDELAHFYLRELGWREFAHYLLYHFPDTPKRPLRPSFEAMPWRRSKADFRAWKRGETGYPLVDAGMRELWRTGWMHNRVRMVVGSFLVKHLLLPWQQGAAWFWDTLVDADLANNTLGWQWCAGCGADAAPYFRIFNPVSQGAKYDPYGAYVRHWVPELARLPARWIHEPWHAPESILSAAGVELGVTYPKPMVDHAMARARALEAFATVKKSR